MINIKQRIVWFAAAWVVVAVVTAPVWAYVVVTGWLIYWMLHSVG